MLGWLIEHFNVDRGAFFIVNATQAEFHFGLDRNEKLLEKFSFDKRVLNKSQKQSLAQYPKEADLQAKRKRCWVIPFLLEGKLQRILYLDCLTDSDDGVENEVLNSYYLLSEQFLLNRIYPDQTKTVHKEQSRKNFKFSYNRIIGQSKAMFKVFETLD